MQKKNEFQTITSNMNEGLVLLGSDKKIITLNLAAKSFLAVSTDHIGKYFIEIERDMQINQTLKDAEKEDASEVQVKHGCGVYQLNISCLFAE